jgi:hypothetical protein
MKRSGKTNRESKQIQRSTTKTAIARAEGPKAVEPVPSAPAGTEKRGAISRVDAETDPATGKPTVTVATDPTKLVGTDSIRVAHALIEQSLNTIPSCNQGDAAQKVETVCHSLEGLNPQTTVEGLLCAQMLGTHNLAMEFMRRSLLPGQTFDGATSETNRAVRLLRVFVEQTDALQRLRGKAGQQTVTVEHVHVHEGGQAIVGTVTAKEPGRGVGDDRENR